jgi:hypothetical protein|tara:strand:- start:1575 stop:1796 length:222 start_codon:yes stop_codon:yes gene_type:complete
VQEKENISAEREFIDTKQLAKRWNKSYKTIESWRATGRGPSYYKLGNRILYDLNEIKNIEDQAYISTNETRIL